MSKKLVKISKNVRFLSTFFAPPCANCSKRAIRSFESLVLSFELQKAGFETGWDLRHWRYGTLAQSDVIQREK